MHTVYTIGHSSHPASYFASLLVRHSIEVVVDTRSAPYSKFTPQFDRELIQALLQENGVRYLFLGAEVGGRPKKESYYDADGRALYSKMSEDDEFLGAIGRIEKGIQQYRVALLCSEEDPAHCHRRLLVGRVLAERGHMLLHIRKDAQLMTDEAVTQISGKDLATAQPALFAELDEAKWKSTASVSPKKVQRSSLER